MQKNVIIVSILVVILVAAIGLSLSMNNNMNSNNSSQNKSNSSSQNEITSSNSTVSSSPTPTSTSSSPTPTPTSSSNCNIVFQPNVKSYSSYPQMCISQDKIYTGVIKTNMGDINFELIPKYTPLTVNSFYFLAKSGFFNGLTFHRVVKGFVIQGGDPLGDGTGGPGYKFNDEINSSTNIVSRGVLAMANSGPNTNGSQFFIPVADEPNLNSGYTVFGKVTSGMDVVDKIDNVAVDANDKPLSPVTITEIDITGEQ